MKQCLKKRKRGILSSYINKFLAINIILIGGKNENIKG